MSGSHKYFIISAGIRQGRIEEGIKRGNDKADDLRAHIVAPTFCEIGFVPCHVYHSLLSLVIKA